MYNLWDRKNWEPPSPGNKQSREGRFMWVLLDVLGQRGASFNALAREYELGWLFSFLKEGASEIRGQEALGCRISPC